MIGKIYGETVNVTPLAKGCLILVMLLLGLMIIDQLQTIIHHYRINKLELKNRRKNGNITRPNHNL